MTEKKIEITESELENMICRAQRNVYFTDHFISNFKKELGF